MDGRTTAAVACVVAGNAWLLLAVTVVFRRTPLWRRYRPRAGARPIQLLLRTGGYGWLEDVSADTLVLAPGDVRDSGGADDLDARDHLLRGLRSREPEVRRASVAALAHLGHRHEWAIDGLIEALAEHADSPASVAGAARPCGAAGWSRLVPLLGHPSSVVRSYAVRLLAGHGDHVVQQATELTWDPLPQVRAAALETLSALPTGETLRCALRLLEDPHPLVRVEACKTAGAISGVTAAPFVVPLLTDPSWWVREAAREALVTSGGDVVPAILPALQDEDPEVRNRAAPRAPGARGGRRAARGRARPRPARADPRRRRQAWRRAGRRAGTAQGSGRRALARARGGHVTLGDALRTGVLLCAAYLSLVYAMHLALMLVGFAESRRRRRLDGLRDLGAVAGSRFSPPVSILVPAHNEGATIVDAVRSLLALDYLEYEVIVVNDGSTDDTLALLEGAFDLVPVELPSRAVETEPVRGQYRSRFEPRLLVLDKPEWGKADALNAGLNHCRHRYVCGVDSDMVFGRDALAQTMGAFIGNSGTVVGLTSFFETTADPAASLVGGVDYRIPDQKPLLLYQALDYLRAFFNNRIAWTRYDFMLCAAGAFQIWRRDLLDELRGWSRAFTCEDIELTFRVHRLMRERGAPYRILSLPHRVGVTEGPDTMRKLIAQRERWQRVILETWWANRRM